MTRPEQKRREQEILLDCLRRLGIDDEVVIERGETPDFLVRHRGMKLGFEIVEYHEPKLPSNKFSRRQVENSWGNIQEASLRYMYDRAGLGKLSVRLEFKELRLPNRNEINDFIQAIVEMIRRSFVNLTSAFQYYSITSADPLIIRQYVSSIAVRRCKSWLNWDWNFSFGGIGTSDAELMATVGPKLQDSYRQLEKLYLVVVDGPGLSRIIGVRSVDQLKSFSNINCALLYGQFDYCCLLDRESTFLWSRSDGWQQVR